MFFYWISPYIPPLWINKHQSITICSNYQLKFNVQMKHTKQMNTFSSLRSLGLVWRRCQREQLYCRLYSLPFVVLVKHKPSHPSQQTSHQTRSRKGHEPQDNVCTYCIWVKRSNRHKPWTLQLDSLEHHDYSTQNVPYFSGTLKKAVHFWVINQQCGNVKEVPRTF